MSNVVTEPLEARWQGRLRIRGRHDERLHRPDTRVRSRTLDGPGGYDGVHGSHDEAFRMECSQERRARTVNSLYGVVNPLRQ